MDICFDIYVSNCQNNKPCRFTSSFELCTLFQKLVQKAVKKRTLDMKLYYIIPLNYQLTGHPENFKIKLYYFQERLSLLYKIILKLRSPLYFMYVSSDITSKRTYFLKSIPEVENSLFYFILFYIIDHSVYDQLLPYLK